MCSERCVRSTFIGELILSINSKYKMATSVNSCSIKTLLITIEGKFNQVSSTNKEDKTDKTRKPYSLRTCHFNYRDILHIAKEVICKSSCSHDLVSMTREMRESKSRTKVIE